MTATPTPVPAPQGTAPHGAAPQGAATGTSDPPTPRRRKTLVLVGVLAVAVAVAVLPAYTGLDPSRSRVDVRNFAPWHYAALLVHIAPAVLALIIGPLQFSASIRRHRGVHRAIGRIYTAAVVLGSLGGAVVGVLSTAGPTAWVGFVMLDILWAATTIAGWRAGRQHRHLDHAAWMTRSYALTFAGVTLRVWLVLLTLALQPLKGGYFHGDGDLLMTQAYLVTPWLSWVPNLIIAELLTTRLRKSRTQPTPPR